MLLRFVAVDMRVSHWQGAHSLSDRHLAERVETLPHRRLIGYGSLTYDELSLSHLIAT